MLDDITEPIDTELQNIEARLSELMRYMCTDRDFNDLQDARNHVMSVQSRREEAF